MSEAQPAAPPPLRAKALASLLETPVQVTIGPLEFEVAVPKADFWLKALLDDPIDWDMILPGLLSEEEQVLLEEGLMDGTVEMEDLTKALVEMVAEVSGLKWYTTVILCTLQRDIWERTGAHLILAGLRPETMTFGAWMIAIFTSVMEKIDPKEAANFVTTITTPPPGYEEELDFEAEESAFMSAMSMM